MSYSTSVGEAEIEVNLAPTEVVRDLAWASKTKWFVAAAGIALVASGMMFIKPFSAQTAMGAGSIAGASEVDSVVRLAKKNKSDLDRISADANIGFSSTNLERLLDDREVWPYLVTDAMNAVASAGPQPELLGSDLEKIKAIDPAKRNLVLLEDFGAIYTPSGDGRFLEVEMKVAFSNDDERGFINDTIGRFINDLATAGVRDGVPYVVVPGSFSSNPGDLQIVKVTDTGENEVSGGSSSRAANAGKNTGRDSGRGTGRGTGRGGGQTGGPTGTGFAAGGGAGQPGKKKADPSKKVNPDADPTGGGFASSGGGFTGSRGGFGGGDQDAGSGFGDAGSRRPNQRVDDKVDYVDLATDAAIPGDPSLYSPGDVFHVGRVTFRVKLNED